MRTLLLLRHAKSSWSDPTLADHERPLKRRGVKAARQMARQMKAEHLVPELVLCSTAVRARETLRLVLDESELTPPVQELERLYHCSPGEFLAVLRDVPADLQTVLIVGHNPGMEEFLAHLIGRPEPFHTAALASISLKIDDWSQLDADARGELTGLWRPRELDD